MELKDFISMEKPWEYNFEFECGDEDYKKLETFDRFFVYSLLPTAADYENVNRFIKKKFGYLPVNDPDASDNNAYYPIVPDIYESLWNYKKEKPGSRFAQIQNGKFGNCLFGGDTMNSVRTVLGFQAGKNPNGNFSMFWAYNSLLGDRTSIENEWAENGLKDYIDSYHTLGNFVLVPAGFNGWRGRSRGKIKDFWDRSLEHLKTEGYEDFKRDNFKQYINYFFLWDYVDKDYSVKNFSPKNPSDKDELRKFFETATDRIYRRGKFMTAMLIIATEKDLYQKIQEKIIDRNDINGIDGAAKFILKEFKNKLEDEKFKEAKNWLEELGDNKI